VKDQNIETGPAERFFASTLSEFVKKGIREGVNPWAIVLALDEIKITTQHFAISEMFAENTQEK